MAGKVGLGIITRLVTHIPVGTGRQFGFAFHPNFLAAGLTICMPLAMWMVFSENRRDRLWGYVSLPGLILGVWASGSRGGAICAAIALVVSVVLLPRARKSAPIILLSIAGVVGVTFAVVPSVGLKILKATRLVGGGQSTSGSDTARSIVAHQGWLDFLHSPIDGIGLQVATEAQNVYLQELASGGLILFVAMQVYLFSSIYYSARLIRRHDMGAAFVGVGIAIACLNVFEADLTDRFYYVPAAILVSLLYVDRMEDSEADEMRALEADTAAAAARQARRAAMRARR
jgi:O-antigen ligase